MGCSLVLLEECTAPAGPGCLVPVITARLATAHLKNTKLVCFLKQALSCLPLQTWCSVLFVLHSPGNPCSGAAGISSVPAPNSPKTEGKEQKMCPMQWGCALLQNTQYLNTFISWLLTKVSVYFAFFALCIASSQPSCEVTRCRYLFQEGIQGQEQPGCVWHSWVPSTTLHLPDTLIIHFSERIAGVKGSAQRREAE